MPAFPPVLDPPMSPSTRIFPEPKMFYFPWCCACDTMTLPHVLAARTRGREGEQMPTPTPRKLPLTGRAVPRTLTRNKQEMGSFPGKGRSMKNGNSDRLAGNVDPDSFPGGTLTGS
eukprot:EG_transcript_34782